MLSMEKGARNPGLASFVWDLQGSLNKKRETGVQVLGCSSCPLNESSCISDPTHPPQGIRSCFYGEGPICPRMGHFPWDQSWKRPPVPAKCFRKGRGGRESLSVPFFRDGYPLGQFPLFMTAWGRAWRPEQQQLWVTEAGIVHQAECEGCVAKETRLELAKHSTGFFSYVLSIN